MNNPITCIRVTGSKADIDRVISGINPFLAKLLDDRGDVFKTILDYPRSILLKFDDSRDANVVVSKISKIESKYVENNRRTEFGTEKRWLDGSGAESLKIVVMHEHLGYERGWKI